MLGLEENQIMRIKEYTEKIISSTSTIYLADILPGHKPAEN